MSNSFSRFTLASAVFLSALAQTEAVLTINVRETGGDVVVTYAGSLSLDGLALNRTVSVGTEMAPHAGFILSSPDGERVDEYQADSPVNFPYFGEGASGSSTSVFLVGDSSRGAPFGLGFEHVFVPEGYLSNQPLSGSAIYRDASLTSLNLERGVYTTALPNDVLVLIVGSGLTSQPPAPDPQPEPEPEPEPEPQPEPVSNVVENGGFDSDWAHWTFYTNGTGNAVLASPGYGGSASAALIEIDGTGSNTQLFQNDIALESGKEYRLTFAAYSNTGRNMRVSLNKHSSPYTNYGLNRAVVDLSEGWDVYTLTFTATGFGGFVKNARLYFWFSSDARAGDRYYIDELSLSIEEL